jgi:membrane protein required for colicin V production
MIIDLIFLALLAFALIKGIKKGLAVAVFSLLAMVVGLAAALKLSALVAEYLKGSVNISAKWLPFIAFIFIFVGVGLLARLVAKIIEAAAEAAMMGWLNKLGGVVFYFLINTLVFSIVLFYLDKLQLISPQTIAESSTFGFVKPWGPWLINGIGTWWPVFKDVFGQLEDFFAQFA